MPKVVFCIPTIKRPFQQCLESLKASIPDVEAAGWDHAMVAEVGSPYISCARSTMLRKAMTAGADAVVFIDHDLAWRPEDLAKLLETKADVAAGTYRMKQIEPEEYMGQVYSGPGGTPLVREDGCIQAELVPAGFLKLTAAAVDRFEGGFPDLVYGPRHNPSIDLFNHGAHDGLWWGEDYAFSRNWRSIGGDIWLVPDLQLTHYKRQDDGTCEGYVGNFHEYLKRQPGGAAERSEMKSAA